MNRERTRLLRYLTVILLLVIAVGVAGYFILQPKTMVGGPYPWRPGWKTIAVRDLRLKLVDVWSAEAPPAIFAASKNTQLAWVLLDVCRYWPDADGSPEAMLHPYWPEEVVLGPDHPFTRLVALGKDAVPACIEVLQSERLSKDFFLTHQVAMKFIDLTLICAVTGADWREVLVLGSPHRRWVPSVRPQLWKSAVPDAEFAFADLFVEGAAWVKWYDGGMKTPLPPLIQYQLDHPIGEQPEYYDQFGRPRHMDPEDLEGLPLPSGPVSQKAGEAQVE